MNNNTIMVSNSLNKKFTFDNFIASENNQLGYALSYNVTEFPGKSYNPLYLYSNIDIYKTHLLHAIGNKILQNNKDLNVYYITLHNVLLELIEFSHKQNTNDIIKKFESLDVLLIDDFLYLPELIDANKLLCDIIENLINKEKQVVIGSNTHINNISNLDKKFTTKFTFKNIVEIKSYDF